MLPYLWSLLGLVSHVLLSEELACLESKWAKHATTTANIQKHLLGSFITLHL